MGRLYLRSPGQSNTYTVNSNQIKSLFCNQNDKYNTTINNNTSENDNGINQRSNVNNFQPFSNVQTKRFSTFQSQSNSTFNTNAKLLSPQKIDSTIKDLELTLLRTGAITFPVFQGINSKIVWIIRNQWGSRVLQAYLAETSPEILTAIYQEIHDKWNFLWVDPYANYFCLKLFEFLPLSNKIHFLIAISKNIHIFSINKISTYPIQCIIGCVSTEQEKEILLSSVKNHFYQIALDIYGTHVLEKILICFDEEHCKELTMFIITNFITLSCNVNGWCIVKRFLKIDKTSRNYKRIKEILMINLFNLVENPYGNYAIQVAIDNWDIRDVEEIAASFKGFWTELSQLKYSSNVIEKCLKKSPNFNSMFINEICVEKNSLECVIKNNFGNYVIQTCWKTAKDISKLLWINSIDSIIMLFEDKKLIIKWKNIIKESVQKCIV